MPPPGSGAAAGSPPPLPGGAGITVLEVPLVGLGSRRGFDTYRAEGRLDDREVVRAALSRSVNPITQAFLLPYAPEAPAPPAVIAIEPLVERKLRAIAPA